MFSFVLQYGDNPPKSDPKQNHFLTSFSEKMGGSCQFIHTTRDLQLSLESLATKLFPTTIVNFEPVHAAHPNALPSSYYVPLFIRSNTGYWPIPESFFVDQHTSSLPARTSHPILKIGLLETDPYIPNGFPFDKYEIDGNSEISSYFISQKKKGNLCSQVFVEHSSKSGVLEPFGYVKASVTSDLVSLFVLPFNYPKLWPLLDELVSVHKMNPVPKWRYLSCSVYVSCLLILSS